MPGYTRISIHSTKQVSISIVIKFEPDSLISGIKENKTISFFYCKPLIIRRQSSIQRMVLPGTVSEIDLQASSLNYPVIWHQNLMRIQVVRIESNLRLAY